MGWSLGTDYLRRASADWQQRYAACEHTSVHIDQIGRDGHEFHERSVPFVEHAVAHEGQARERWPRWSPVSMDPPHFARTAENE